MVKASKHVVLFKSDERNMAERLRRREEERKREKERETERNRKGESTKIGSKLTKKFVIF